jgi:ornithine decarboxylase
MKHQPEVRILPDDADRTAVDLARKACDMAGHPEEPLVVCDLGRAIRCAQRWRAQMPNVRAFYAVKCHPDPVLVETLLRMGCGLDCASRAEIELAISLGARPDRDVIYANPCKRSSDIEYARDVGVQLVTLDSVHEVRKLASVHPTCRALLRIRSDDPRATLSLGKKFGAEQDEWRDVLREAKARALDMRGISFHVGSGSAPDGLAYSEAICEARGAWDMMVEMGFEPDVLDIGGGFVPTRDDELPPELVINANASLKIWFGDVMDRIQVIAEPGRYFAEPYAMLVAQVIGVRERKGVRELWLNDGVYGVLSCVKDDGYVPHPLAFVDGEPAMTRLFGPTCDSIDEVCSNVMLPRQLDVGDRLVFERVGAYSCALATDFNGVRSTRAPRLYVCERDFVDTVPERFVRKSV